MSKYCPVPSTIFTVVACRPAVTVTSVQCYQFEKNLRKGKSLLIVHFVGAKFRVFFTVDRSAITVDIWSGQLSAFADQYAGDPRHCFYCWTKTKLHRENRSMNISAAVGAGSWGWREEWHGEKQCCLWW